jgi:hypothetical protein
MVWYLIWIWENVLWHNVRKPEQWNQSRRPLLGNCPVNIFPRQRKRKQQSNNFSFMQRSCKHGFLTTERLCFLTDPYKLVINKNSVENNGIGFRGANLPRCELGSRGIELNPVGSCRNGNKELGCQKKTSCVIWSDSKIVINPLPGYD